jgi:hypothetical protein
MAKFLLSRRARADLREIWNYTADHWDIHQADRYVLQIRAAIQAMADDPAKGRPCDHIRPGYRNIPWAFMSSSSVSCPTKLKLSAFCTNAWILSDISSSFTWDFGK